jgi:hypothetical protein
MDRAREHAAGKPSAANPERPSLPCITPMAVRFVARTF